MADGGARNALLDAAAMIVEGQGWDGLRMSDVAARAGYGRQTAYYHFRNTSDLLAAVVDRFYGRLGERVMARVGGARTSPQPAHGMIVATVRLMCEEDAAARVAIVARDLPRLREG